MKWWRKKIIDFDWSHKIGIGHFRGACGVLWDTSDWINRDVSWWLQAFRCLQANHADVSATSASGNATSASGNATSSKKSLLESFFCLILKLFLKEACLQSIKCLLGAFFDWCAFWSQELTCSFWDNEQLLKKMKNTLRFYSLSSTTFITIISINCQLIKIIWSLKHFFDVLCQVGG